MAPTQLCARAHNWVKAIELGAFVKGAFIYARVGRKSFHDLRTVVRALFVEQEMFVNQASGLVISPQPGAIDLLPANQDDLFDATAELSVRCWNVLPENIRRQLRSCGQRDESGPRNFSSDGS